MNPAGAAKGFAVHAENQRLLQRHGHGQVQQKHWCRVRWPRDIDAAARPCTTLATRRGPRPAGQVRHRRRRRESRLKDQPLEVAFGTIAGVHPLRVRLGRDGAQSQDRARRRRRRCSRALPQARRLSRICALARFDHVPCGVVHDSMPWHGIAHDMNQGLIEAADDGANQRPCRRFDTKLDGRRVAGQIATRAAEAAKQRSRWRKTHAQQLVAYLAGRPAESVKS